MVTWMLCHLNWAVIIVGALLTAVLFIYYFSINESKSVLSYVPNIWTSLGILGTFVSIVHSLNGLDFVKVDSSIVENLVREIVPAFETSIIGIIGAIITSIVIKMIFAESDSSDNYSASRKEDELLEHVERISRNEERIYKSIDEIKTKVIEEIVAEVNTALVSKLEELIRAHSATICFFLKEEKELLEKVSMETAEAFIVQTKQMEKVVADFGDKSVSKLSALSVAFSNGCQTISDDAVSSINTLKNEIISALSLGIGKQSDDFLAKLDVISKDVSDNLIHLKETSREMKYIASMVHSSSSQHAKTFANLEEALINDIDAVEERLSKFLEKLDGSGADVKKIYEKFDEITEMNYALNFRLAQLGKGYRTEKETSFSPIECSNCHLVIENAMANFCPKCGNNLYDEVTRLEERSV